MQELLSREYEVNFSHIDNRGEARPSFLFHMMQDVATVHACNLNIDAQTLHVVWVLSRIKVNIKRSLLPYEKVRCDTWCPGVRGASWFRSFRFHTNGENIGDAQSMWVTLDPLSRRILRPNALRDMESFIMPGGEKPEPLPKLSCENVRLHHEHRVNYSDLDVNNHLNNVRIADIVTDTLDLQKQPGSVSSLQINYTAETMCGETLSLFCGSCGGARFVKGEAGGKTRFEALAKLVTVPKEEIR